MTGVQTCALPIFLRHESLRRALAASGHDGSLADPAFAAFLQARQRVTLYDDVVPVLERWSRRFRLVALSNGNADIESNLTNHAAVRCVR